MPSLQRIESQVAALPDPELRQFRSWLDEFDAQRWDRSLAEEGKNKMYIARFLLLRDVENADLPFCRSVFQNAIAVTSNNAAIIAFAAGCRSYENN